MADRDGAGASRHGKSVVPVIRVQRVPEPAAFDGKARQPGKAWLAANPGAKRPKDLWSAFKSDLRDGFQSLCGYSAMFDPTGGTVDHYLSCRDHQDLAYEWSNYRFASSTMNSIKRNADDAVLDPFEVGGWMVRDHSALSADAHHGARTTSTSITCGSNTLATETARRRTPDPVAAELV